MRAIPILTLASLMLPAPGRAQTRPTFEAASIKPNKGCPGPYGRNLPGRLAMNCYSIQELVAFAWGVRKDQVVGQLLPDRYDIEATMDAATPINQIYGPMLQALLEDRLALKFHRETRDVPIYNLVVAKSGSNMPPAKGGCVVFFCDHPSFGVRGTDRTVDGKGVTMKALSESLSRTELNRSVVDKTGLAGAFDVTLKWITDPSDPLYDGLGGPPTSEPGTGPSLFTALQEQLGLRLEAGRGPVDVLVIDRVEKPAQ